jgi:hypothetical protein
MSTTDKAITSMQWHRDQKRTATHYKFPTPEIPGDYAGGGPWSGASSVPPQPAGTEKETFIDMRPTIRPWVITVAIAVGFFGYLTTHKK